MHSLPPYHPLSQKLRFEASVRIVTRQGNTTGETQLRYPLTLQPAPAQGWGPYCLAVTRGLSEYTSYTPNAADEVVALLAQPLRYLEITLGADGRALKLRNHAAIWQQWQKETAPSVVSAYAGPWVEKLIAQTEVELLHADALLRLLLERDFILHPYLSVVAWLAGGTDGPLPFRLAGGPVQLQEDWHFSTLPNGTRALETAAAGPARKVLAQPRQIVPKGARGAEGSKDFWVAKTFSYTFLPNSVWPSGWSGNYCFDGGAAFEKNIYLQLMLL